MNSFEDIEFDKIKDLRGNLSFIEFPKNLPFQIKRVFWIYDVPSGETRGGHAFKKSTEVIVALSGSFNIVITSPDKEQWLVTLNQANKGIILPPLTWRHMDNFSTNSLALHISNTFYSENDYIRDFSQYKSFRDGK